MTNLAVLATEGVEEAPPNPVIPELNELVWAAIFFFVLWALMKYVLLPPIQRGMAAREQAITSDRDAADSATADLGAARRDYEASLAEARTEASSLIEQARARADQRKAELQAAADAEIAELRREAQADIEATKAGAVTALRDDVADLAVGAASAVIGRPLDAASQRSVVDGALRSSEES